MRATHFISMDEAGEAFPVQVSGGELVDILAEAAAAVRPLRAAEIELPDGATPQEADWSTGSSCDRSVQGPVSLDDFDEFLMATAEADDAHHYEAPRT